MAITASLSKALTAFMFVLLVGSAANHVLRRVKPTGEKKDRNLLEFHKSTQHITIANITKSPLLRLPPEIRDKIFRYAVTAEDAEIYLPYDSNFDSRDNWDRYLVFEKGAAAVFLPLVCRQIYSECATMCAKKIVCYAAL
ncbi:hypothetical protein P171DRAFT_487422 [Karstenula rhodostoma CBS 690.94]|uniref:F-box domain-containing protein n=1 Tax=Karstenula rhodostoma CBS 690.94 TaxID=1392251 RepID=A0A9P4PE25_9PLEO|nr:hypothetical protein P171DRAFT_487422 [Karstenula rhodostoma CBS 690.94]